MDRSSPHLWTYVGGVVFVFEALCTETKLPTACQGFVVVLLPATHALCVLQYADTTSPAVVTNSVNGLKHAYVQCKICMYRWTHVGIDVVCIHT